MKSRKQKDGVSVARRSSNKDHLRKGAFTRSFIHRSRSGRARADSAPKLHLPPFRRSHAKIPMVAELGRDTSDPAVVGGSIIDLRARRVFSPRASTIECFQMGDAAVKMEVNVNGEQLGGASDKEGVYVVRSSFPHPIDTMDHDNVGGGEGIPIPADLMEEGNTIGGGVDAGIGGVGDGVGGIIMSEGSNIESTPPGPECFLDPPAGSGSAVLTRPDDMFASGRSATKSKGVSPPRKFRNRPGLVPCSRTRLFSTPNSHCYRRLLPYIMDLTKNNQSTLEIIPVKPQGRKLKSAAIEITTPTPLTHLPLESNDASEKQSETDGLGTDSENSKFVSNKQHGSEVNVETYQTGNSASALPMLLETGLVGASSLLLETSGVDTTPILLETRVVDAAPMLPEPKVVDAAPILLEYKVVDASSMLLESEQPRREAYKQSEPYNMDNIPSECPTEYLITEKRAESEFPTVIQITSNSPTQRDFTAPSREYGLRHNTSSLPGGKNLSVEELLGPMQPTSVSKAPLPVQKKEECWQLRSVVKSDVLGKISSGSSKPGQLLPAINNHHIPIKGILKRPMIGCKGPCTCLDCASFRLNAERAFEFSRRQYFEADNIAETLMKELSCLRRLVTNTIVPSVVTSDKLSQVQVRDICRKASEVETAARNRLREMESDLNVHCRISRYLRQKVTFAGPIDDEDSSKS